MSLLYSELMCWVALDRAIKLAVLLGAQSRIPHWSAVRGRIRTLSFRMAGMVHARLTVAGRADLIYVTEEVRFTSQSERRGSRGAGRPPSVSEDPTEIALHVREDTARSLPAAPFARCTESPVTTDVKYSIARKSIECHRTNGSAGSTSDLHPRPPLARCGCRLSEQIRPELRGPLTTN